MTRFFSTILVVMAAFNFAQADGGQINDGLVWLCHLDNVEVERTQSRQLIPILGILYKTKHEGPGVLTCMSLLRAQVATTPVYVTLKSKGAGLGTATPKSMGMFSLGTGLKVNSPDDLFGKYSAGARASGTLFTVSGGIGVKFQHPEGGPAMDLALIGERSEGLKASVDVFSLKIEKDGETVIESTVD